MSTTATADNVTTVVPPAAGAEETVGVRPYRMSFDRYWAIVASGALDKTRVFLWDGELLEKMPPGRPHSNCLYTLKAVFDRLLPAGFFAEQEQPMALDGKYAPQPDLKVVRGALGDYPSLPPAARDVPLALEVADGSLRLDTGVVLRNYAAAGIPIYWIVNLNDRRVEVYAEPSGPSETPAYGRRDDYGPGDEVPVTIDGREVGRVAVRDILP